MKQKSEQKTEQKKRRRERPHKDLLISIRFKQAHDLYNVGEVTARLPAEARKLVSLGIAEVITPEQIAAEKESRRLARVERVQKERDRILSDKESFDALARQQAEEAERGKAEAAARRAERERAKQEKLAKAAQEAEEKALRLKERALPPAPKGAESPAEKGPDGPPASKQVEEAPIKK